MKVGFDGGIKLEFYSAKVTSNRGLLVYRDLDDVLGLFDSVFTVCNDKRTGRNIQHAMPTLLRQSIYSCLPRYCLGLNECVAILFNFSVIGLIKWIRVSKMKYFFVFQAYCKKNIMNCMQKYLQKELGRGNIRLSISFLRILTAHDFNMGKKGLVLTY